MSEEKIQKPKPMGHPAKDAPNRWFFDDWSHESTDLQIIDLLHDIRLFLLVIMLLVAFF